MIKIQKAMTYPKAADMMQLLDANTEEYLPLKIIVCENKVGKVEFFAEEMKKENGIGFLARDEKSRTFSSNSKRSHILRTSSRSRRLILSSIVSFAVWLKCTRTI